MDDSEESIPQSFLEVVANVQNYALQEIAQEVENKQLYYHTIAHALAVQRRANLIFQVIQSTESNFAEKNDCQRVLGIINIVAIAHDMVQEFLPNTELYTPRKRVKGVSETKTIEKLISYIQNLNHQILEKKPHSSIIITDSELNTIEESIRATICDRDKHNGLIYQPDLYRLSPELSLTARIIALADLGTLGIDGIEDYLQESILVFLEDNLDIAQCFFSQLSSHNFLKSCQLNFDSRLNLKQRLLQASRFIVSFAQDRLSRFEVEISGFPQKIQASFQDKVFQHFTPKTIQKLETIIPTSDSTELKQLLTFFTPKL